MGGGERAISYPGPSESSCGNTPLLAASPGVLLVPSPGILGGNSWQSNAKSRYTCVRMLRLNRSQRNENQGNSEILLSSHQRADVNKEVTINAVGMGDQVPPPTPNGNENCSSPFGTQSGNIYQK